MGNDREFHQAREKNMQITIKENTAQPSMLSCVAQQGAFEFRQVFSKTIASERIKTYFKIQAEVVYEQYLEERGG